MTRTATRRAMRDPRIARILFLARRMTRKRLLATLATFEAAVAADRKKAPRRPIKGGMMP